MCGIFAVFGYLQGDIEQFRPKAISLSKRIRHRGPDWSGIRLVKNNILCHERLAIVGVDSGAQPLTNEAETVILCVNGEIYNHKELRKKLIDKRRMEKRPAPVFRTGSDCEVILNLYEEYGPSCVNYLDGMFAFVLYDKNLDRYIAARDPIGIIPLYQGTAEDGSVWFASEMKAIFEDCVKSVHSFEPGTIYDSRSGHCERWFKPQWWDERWAPKSSAQITALNQKVDAESMHHLTGKVHIDEQSLRRVREALERAVFKQLMTEVPFGVLLSGGLDSSLIAAIAARYTAKAAHDSLDEEPSEYSPTTPTGGPANALWSPRLHSFSVGLPGSPDLVAAKRVAKYLHTIHHEYTFTVQEGLDAVHDVIYHLETYDVTTVRASTPMYLMSRKIKATGVKMVLSGEGSDEVFGGYLYFHQAPTPNDLHEETVKRVKLLHTSDCLRANKSTMAWGLEARVPFLDSRLLDVAMTLPPEFKHPKLTEKRIEKELLRQAFDIEIDDGLGHNRPYLPADILWRQKEQFSDGVGYSWIDSMKAHAEQIISDEQFAEREFLFPHQTPTTKEAFWIRQIFEQYFCPENLCPDAESKQTVLETVVKWIPRKDWGCAEDPSGRAQQVHAEAYNKAARQIGNVIGGGEAGSQQQRRFGNNNPFDNANQSHSAVADNQQRQPGFPAATDDPEEEFLQVDRMLGQAKSIRQETLELTRQGLSRLQETELSASSTMGRLATQSETLHQSKRDLDTARQHQNLAEDQVRELKRLNKWFSFRNPFRRAARSKQVEKEIEKSYTEKMQREIDTRRGESATKQRVAMSSAPAGVHRSLGSQRFQSASGYQSELLDEQDFAHEREIDENIDEIGSAVGRLKMMATAMNDEIQSQNKLIGGLGSQADDMNVRIGITQHSIKKFG